MLKKLRVKGGASPQIVGLCPSRSFGFFVAQDYNEEFKRKLESQH
jgi:hypothetical protein